MERGGREKRGRTQREPRGRRRVNEEEPPMILLGDFNAHNPLWGSEK